MNTEVTATDMKVTAVAEDGILIAAFVNNTTMPATDSADFAATDATNAAAMANMHPTITADTTTWYHAASTQSANGQAYDAKTGYSTVDNVADDPSTNTVDETTNYYHLNKFAIKSTGSAQAVYVKDITVDIPASATAQAYSDSLRVIVKSDDATLLYAPVGTRSGASLTETLLASTATASTTTSHLDDAVTADIAITFMNPTQYNTAASKILDDVAATPEEVDIYIFYDGEDAACKSDNIPADAFQQLTVSVTFTSTAPSTNP